MMVGGEEQIDYSFDPHEGEKVFFSLGEVGTNSLDNILMVSSFGCYSQIH